MHARPRLPETRLHGPLEILTEADLDGQGLAPYFSTLQPRSGSGRIPTAQMQRCGIKFNVSTVDSDVRVEKELDSAITSNMQTISMPSSKFCQAAIGANFITRLQQ
jgi:hypothetical protein